MLDKDSIKTGSQSNICACAVLIEIKTFRTIFNSLSATVMHWWVLFMRLWCCLWGDVLRTAGSPLQTYLGLIAFLAITFYFFHLLHVQHLCLWRGQTPGEIKMSAKTQRNKCQLNANAEIQRGKVIKNIALWILCTWKTGREEPLSEWPLQALGHPGSSPAKKDMKWCTGHIKPRKAQETCNMSSSHI